MIQISGEEFQKKIRAHFDWALLVSEPVAVTTYVNMEDSEITQLSPLLHFVGKNWRGDVANFAGCQNLKIAEGNFNGYANFAQSTIQRIGDLKITGVDTDGHSASFWGCEELTMASGEFAGHVDFSGSEVKDVGNLIIHAPNSNGRFIDIENTPLVDKNPQKLIQHLWGNKKLNEWEKICSSMGDDQKDLKSVLETMIQTRLETARRKNAAVEIQID